jgi:hypothetical protein
VATPIAWADVTAVDAALSAVPVAAQSMYLAEANALAPASFDGDDGPKFKLARVYLAAHRGRRQLDVAGGGAAGPVASESLGGMSVTYAAPVATETDSDLAMSVWGQAYARLCRNSIGRIGGRR